MLIKFETKWTPTLRSFTQETLSDSVLENPILWKDHIKQSYVAFYCGSSMMSEILLAVIILLFQFAPGTSSEVLITSADSRVRVIDGVDLVHTFKALLAIFGDEKMVEHEVSGA